MKGSWSFTLVSRSVPDEWTESSVVKPPSSTARGFGSEFNSFFSTVKAHVQFIAGVGVPAVREAVMNRQFYEMRQNRFANPLNFKEWPMSGRILHAYPGLAAVKPVRVKIVVQFSAVDCDVVTVAFRERHGNFGSQYYFDV
jgi:hypothetical protein